MATGPLAETAEAGLSLPGDPRPDAALAEIWEADLLPLFRAGRSEARRRQRMSRISGIGLFALGLIGAAALRIWPPFPDTSLWIPPLVGFGLCAFFAALVAQENRRGFNSRLKGRILPLLAECMGMRHDHRPAADFLDLRAVAGQRMLAHFTRVDLEDGLTGSWRGMGFRWVEAKLTSPGGGSDDGPGDRRRVSFEGIVMEVETPHPMPWILFQPQTQEAPSDSHATSHSGGTVLQRMRFGGYDLPGGYAVYAADPAAAEAEIGPAFASTLSSIAKRHGRANRPVSGFFHGDRFTLLMRFNRPFLELDAYKVDEAGFAVACRGALEDMMMVRQIIDLLMDGPDRNPVDAPDGESGFHPEQEPGP